MADMSTKGEVWDRIPGSPLGGLYLTEVYWLAETVRRLAEEAFNEAPADAVTGMSYIKVDDRLHANLYALLNAMARLRALLVQRDPRKGQSETQHSFQVKRTRWLRN